MKLIAEYLHNAHELKRLAEAHKDVAAQLQDLAEELSKLAIDRGNALDMRVFCPEEASSTLMSARSGT